MKRSSRFLFLFLAFRFSPLLCTDTTAAGFQEAGHADKGISNRKNKKLCSID